MHPNHVQHIRSPQQHVMHLYGIQCYSSHHDTTSTTPTPPTPHHILTTPRLHQTCTNLCVCVCVCVSFLCIPHLEGCNIPLMGHKTTTGNHTSNGLGISALVQHASCVIIVPLSLPCLSSAIPPRLLSQGQSYVCVSACTAYHTTEASCSTTTRPARRVGSSQDTRVHWWSNRGASGMGTLYYIYAMHGIAYH